MFIYKPLRAALLVYEILRFSVLAFLFAFFSPLEGAVLAGVFPYLVYLTPNALFPMIALFLFIGFPEYKNYLPLYTAGKLIAVITFYVWCIVSLRPLLDEHLLGLDPENFHRGFVLLSGGFILGMTDLFSVFGSFFLLRKVQSFRPEAAAPENNYDEAAIPETGETGGY